MSRWLGLAVDPTSGGTNYDLLSATESPVTPAKPTLWIPAITANVDPGENQIDRNDEVRGRRGNTAPVSFSAQPGLTFESRAYPAVVVPILRRALSGEITSEGGAEPKAKTSKWQSIQSGSLKAFFGWLLREQELDRTMGSVVSEFSLNLPIDAEGTITATLPSLYHDVQESSAPKEVGGASISEWPPSTDYTPEGRNTYKLRDAKAFRGAGEGVEIPNLSGVSITFNNGLITDAQSVFKPGHNIQRSTVGEQEYRLWYPNRHVIGAQNITGTLNLSGVDAVAEAHRLLRVAEKLVIEVAAGPAAGVEPAAEEMLRIILSKHAPAGGGPDPLVREGDQRASIDFIGAIDDATNTDIEVQVTQKGVVA